MPLFVLVSERQQRKFRDIKENAVCKLDKKSKDENLLDNSHLTEVIGMFKNKTVTYIFIRNVENISIKCLRNVK